jgi:hypothetical protein
MKSFKSILCATLLTLAVCSSAFAGNITGGKTGSTTVYGNITGGRAGNITGIVADLLVTLLIP